MTQEQPENTTFEVHLTLRDGYEVHAVTAAYTCYDEMRAPGFIQLRDEDDKIVALAQTGFTALIRRADSDPSRAPKVQLTVNGPLPSPAQIAEIEAGFATAAGVR
jgi:hypothetical protein